MPSSEPQLSRLLAVGPATNHSLPLGSLHPLGWWETITAESVSCRAPVSPVSLPASPNVLGIRWDNVGEAAVQGCVIMQGFENGHRCTCTCVCAEGQAPFPSVLRPGALEAPLSWMVLSPKE